MSLQRGLIGVKPGTATIGMVMSILTQLLEKVLKLVRLGTADIGTVLLKGMHRMQMSEVLSTDVYVYQQGLSHLARRHLIKLYRFSCVRVIVKLRRLCFSLAC